MPCRHLLPCKFMALAALAIGESACFLKLKSYQSEESSPSRIPSCEALHLCTKHSSFLTTRAELQLLQVDPTNAVRATQGPEPLFPRGTSFTSFFVLLLSTPGSANSEGESHRYSACTHANGTKRDVLLAARVISGALSFAYVANHSADPLWA